MIRWALPLLCLVPCSVVHAAGSEVANRNLGVNARQVARVQSQLQGPSTDAAPRRADPARSGLPPPASAGDIRIERIDAYASNIEELDGPDRPAMQKFGERLAADRPLTPAEKAQLILSFFLGGPPGRDPTPEERTEARVARGGTMLARPRGSLQ